MHLQITMIDLLEMWEIRNPDIDFWDIRLNSKVDKEELIHYLISEYGDMRPIAADSAEFRRAVQNFFRVHEFSISKQAETLEFDYLPLDDFHTHQNLNRGTDYWEDNKTVTDYDQTQNYTHNEDETDNRVIENKGSKWQQDVHLVSAFNDNQSPSPAGTDADGNPLYTYKDTEKTRDLMNENHKDKTTDDDTRNQIQVFSEAETQDTDRQYNETNREDVGEVIYKHGATHYSYQELIEQERQQAQFNIYKWIARHFCNDLMIAIW